ncbi:MAG TPA: aldehyde dehydrogenase family protein [Hypericibacter adhaerens]|jgi:acyl-CoA reductase-like NAD-dependent aldehyde dehydrogenase|uniref:Aldehyde dehydrogenase n=1 Tax=Hypericibacter adhaerens TaxID=2602016 RepID=A0A5J6MUW3_9PROT|nr:aldehyde dehydrogenase family protein [Hypericibacter adhaerens]QEX21432.1 aldehyde dehydrogenase [Hypericibacter adhaerens]HWA43205.1 aldehyde dehydrogenase family protein [Hypericibacter adhaerens]
MGAIQKTITPIDDSLYIERPYAGGPEIEKALKAAKAAQRDWKHVPVAERQKYLTKAVDAFVARRDQIAEEITRQIGRPIGQSPGEVRGFEERARYMIAIAPRALADIDVGPKPTFTRFIRREPLGVVFVVAPWNFPYLTSVNAVIPALMAGNAVVLKHSAQTPLCAERFGEAFKAAGLPAGLFQHLVLTHDDTSQVIGNPAVDYVAFTGSVAGGHAVTQAAANRFIGLGLELGGNDPAYVRHDANMAHAIENLVDGAFFNSGQSCCGIQRIFVHKDAYKTFLEGFVDLTNSYKLGNPLDKGTNLGPVVRSRAADEIRGQIQKAVQAGAKTMIDPKHFAADKAGTAYLAPQVLTQLDTRNPFMQEECFGPAVGIAPVADDEEAIRKMNDNPFGLTAAIWTEDEAAAIRIGDRVETGTWFMNRCDYLDPALAWVGVKDSGRGCTLSQVGYEYLTRPKSFHLRTKT